MPTTPPAPPSRFHFDTQALPGADRLAVWREVFGRQVARLDIAPVGRDAPYRAEITALPLDGLSISYCDYERVRSARTHELTADGTDDLIFGFIESGAANVSQRGRSLLVEAGQATVLATAQPNQALAVERTRLFNLVVPRTVLAARVRDVDVHLARAARGDGVALTLLRHYASTLYNSSDQELTAPFIRTAVNHVYDLITLTLGAPRDAEEEARGRGLRAARFAAIKADIAANIHRGDLSAEWIAPRHSISASSVRRLFDEDGITFSQFVLEGRLARAHQLLADPSLGDRTISAIAEALGFNDRSYFNRAFRRLYGETPSTVRETARLAWRDRQT